MVILLGVVRTSLFSRFSRFADALSFLAPRLVVGKSLPATRSTKVAVSPNVALSDVASSSEVKLELDAVNRMIAETRLDISLAQERLGSLRERQVSLEKRIGKSSK